MKVNESEEAAKIAAAAREAAEIRKDLVEKIKAELLSGEIEGDLDLLTAQMLQELGLVPGEEE